MKWKKPRAAGSNGDIFFSCTYDDSFTVLRTKTDMATNENRAKVTYLGPESGRRDLREHDI